MKNIYHFVFPAVVIEIVILLHFLGARLDI